MTNPIQNLDTLVRDLTSVVPKSKSEVRRRIQELVDEAVKAEKKEWLEGRRCEICGDSELKASSQLCFSCWETNYD